MRTQSPEQWKAAKYPDCKTWTVYSNEGTVASKMTESRARLISAAPDLLDILETLLYEMGHAGHLEHYKDREAQARTAIAKAYGAV